jgi:UDP-3-O-acyl-N-acetylglucosamine deacetylase
VAIAMGNSATWDFSLTATELQAAQVNITIADSATKVVDDTGFVIETYGHASAQHEFDFDNAIADANVEEINGVAITGDGSATPFGV